MQRLALFLPLFLIFFTSCSQRTGVADRSAVYVPTTAQPGVIPSGTTVAVRTNERIDATGTGRSFDAQVTRAIVGAQGGVLVPEGSPAQLTIVRVEEPGLAGSGELALAIESLNVGGTRYTVESLPTEVEGDQGIGANRRTAKMVGGGALLGTLVGAIAGGAQGAAIGAAVGAAGGATAQVLTRGDKISIPAETVLSFQLDDAMRLRGFRR
jgi:hypothetical protein